MTEPEDDWIGGLPVFEQQPVPPLPCHVRTAQAAALVEAVYTAHVTAGRQDHDQDEEEADQ